MRLLVSHARSEVELTERKIVGSGQNMRDLLITILGFSNGRRNGRKEMTGLR